MFRFGPLIAAYVLRNRRRTMLTIASTGVSMALFCVLVSMYQALFANPEASPSQALRLVVHHRVSITQPMPVSYENRIRRIPGVADAMVSQWFGGTYKDTREPRNFFARVAVEPDRFFAIYKELDLPDDQRTIFQHLRTSCIVGTKLAERLGWKLGDRVTLIGDIFPVNLELIIAGIYADPENEETLYFNYDYLKELLIATGQSDRANTVGLFLVKATSPEEVDGVAAAIDKEFENSPAPTKSESERVWQLSFISFLGNLKLFLSSICGALTFTMLLVSGNTMSMSIRERIRDVGTLKTIGLTRKTILQIFLGEALVVAATGGIVGVILGYLLCVSVRHSKTVLAALNLEMSFLVVAVVLLAAVAVGLTSAFIPAWSASRTPIIQSLQHQA
ncbi:MAG TPA: FtsX-like permease family protein [Terriglobales bacterium]|nr:FtsX-like permease family protein [Terriglobales bacterium]